MQRNKVMTVKSLNNYFVRDMKVRTKLIICVLTAALFPAMITVAFFYNRFFESSLKTVLESRQSGIAGVDDSIESYIGQIKNTMEVISGDFRLYQIMNSPEEELMLAAKDSSAELKQDFQLFENSLEAYLKEEKLTAIKIYSDRPGELMSQLSEMPTRNVFEPIEMIQYTYWKGLMEISGRSFQYFTGYYLSDYERQNCGSMSCVKKYDYYDKNEKKTAYLVLYYKMDKINELLSEGSSMSEEMYYLIDSRNILITQSDSIIDNIALYMMDYELLDEAAQGEKNFFLQK